MDTRRLNSNSNPNLKFIWDVDIKAYFFVEIIVKYDKMENMDKMGTHSTPNHPELICTICVPMPKSTGF